MISIQPTQKRKKLCILCSSCRHCAGWSSSKNINIPGRSEVMFILCTCPQINTTSILHPALECPHYDEAVELEGEVLAKHIAGWMTCFVDRDPTPERLRNYFSEDLQESEEDE